LDDLDGVKQEQMFFSHRMADRKLYFKQFWQPVNDEQCEGMQVLQPAELVFVGFNDKED
jgi:CRISPR type III-associated protein (TIGR04423 family)